MKQHGGKGQKRIHPHRGGATIGVLQGKYQHFLVYLLCKDPLSPCVQVKPAGISSNILPVF